MGLSRMRAPETGPEIVHDDAIRMHVEYSRLPIGFLSARSVPQTLDTGCWGPADKMSVGISKLKMSN